jgi:RNA-directed DNA polymerase
MWLECPVEETGDRGRKTRTTEARDKRRGIPQGSPISSLLANLYMRRFVMGWKKLGLERSLGTRIVNYADDLVILCRKSTADEALQRLREIMGRLKLPVNEEKTRICKVPEGEFDLLGYTFGRMYSARTGKAAWANGHQGKASVTRQPDGREMRLPVCPEQRTSSDRLGMSEKCHNRKWRPSNDQRLLVG